MTTSRPGLTPDSKSRKRPASRGSANAPTTGPALGWNSRSLLIWAITGWALASLLGILLAAHVIAQRPTTNPQEHASEPAAPDHGESSPAPSTKVGDGGPRARAPESTTTTAPPRQQEVLPVAAEVREPEESNDAAIIAALLRHAAVYTEAGDFDQAIGIYDRVLEREPTNADFKLLRKQVLELRSVARSGGSPTTLSIRETPTEFVASRSGGADQPPEANLGVSVRRATRAPEFPGELVIELRPRVVEPGDPYILRVRLYNKGNRAIDVESLEVVRMLGSSVEGRGQTNPPRVRRANPRDTALLWELAGAWREGQDSGSVEVNVTLADGSHLMKSISW